MRFLIDHEGKVHSGGEPTADGGRVVETLVSLLQGSGARDVKAVSLEIPQLPNEAFRDADRLFKTKAKEALEAHPPGKVAGRIVDGDGRPVADASVQASLQFTMLQFAMPGGYFSISYRGPAGPFIASSGADGRFDIPGLCKGGYLVRVKAPGRAWSERKVYIGTILEPASGEFVLDQGDTISGRVRDPHGKPIAGASVTPTARGHRGGDEHRYTRPAGPDAVKTDDAGQFRFTGLQEGRYIIEIKAAGFKDRELEPIPAGDGNVEVTLEPSS